MGQHNKRLFYSAGLISLIMLPILCIGYFTTREIFEQKFMLEITFWDTDWNEEMNRGYKISYPYNHLPSRQFIDVNIYGDSGDNTKLASAQLAIRELVSKKDSTSGVRFNFGSKSKYNEFIKALNICKIEGATDYIPYQNSIWVYSMRPSERIELESVRSYGCGTRDFVIEIASEDNGTDFIAWLKIFWAPLILFIFMFVLVIVRHFQKSSDNRLALPSDKY